MTSSTGIVLPDMSMLAHTRMGHNIVPYAYGPIYAYSRAEHSYSYFRHTYM